jgi:hypothetical protein
MLIYLICLLIISFVYSEPINLYIKYSDISIDNYSLLFQNYDDFISLSMDDLTYTGKFCFVNNFTQFTNECQNGYPDYNSRWVKIYILFLSR